MNRLLIILLLSLLTTHVSAQSDSALIFTPTNPLVFEDSESIWPYTYLNDKGEPEGYCIDLLRLIMDELHIPYVVRLKNHQEVLKDLKEGRADLILGLGDVYEEKYGHYGRTTITLLTQSVATPKGQSVAINSFRDLKSQQVIVKDSSLCHHLMIDYGWGDHAIVTHDVAKAIQEVNEKGEGQVVWNTLTLKWLINHYHLDNLQLTPVNMPHGQTKFLGRDEHLLAQIDSVYDVLNATEQLAPLERRWLYPDLEAPGRPVWEWYVAALALLVLALAVYVFVRVWMRNRHKTSTLQQLTSQITKISESGKMRFWIYLVKKNKYVWFNEYGEPSVAYDPEEFMKRYNKDDAARLTEAINRLVTCHKDEHNHIEKEEDLELRARDTECGDHELHDFLIDLSVLHRNRKKKPTVIVAVKREVTQEHHLKRINAERSLRYLSVFYNDESGNLLFDADGILQNANPKASELLYCDVDELVKEHIHVNDLFLTEFTDLEAAEGYHGTLTVNDRTVEFQMKIVYNDEEELIGLFVFCV